MDEFDFIDDDNATGKGTTNGVTSPESLKSNCTSSEICSRKIASNNDNASRKNAFRSKKRKRYRLGKLSKIADDESSNADGDYDKTNNDTSTNDVDNNQSKSPSISRQSYQAFDKGLGLPNIDSSHSPLLKKKSVSWSPVNSVHPYEHSIPSSLSSSSQYQNSSSHCKVPITSSRQGKRRRNAFSKKSSSEKCTSFDNFLSSPDSFLSPSLSKSSFASHSPEKSISKLRETESYSGQCDHEEASLGSESHSEVSSISKSSNIRCKNNETPPGSPKKTLPAKSSPSYNSSVLTDDSCRLDIDRRNYDCIRSKTNQIKSPDSDVDSILCSPSSIEDENTSTLSYSNDVVTGAGTDVFAVQDAGSFRFLLDDCNYLCSSFLSAVCVGDHRASEMDTIRHTNITADAACDLVVMLSSFKTRSVLLRLGGNSKETGCSQDSFGSHHSSEDTGFMQTVLDVLSCVPSSIKGSQLPPSILISEITDDMDNNQRCYFLDTVGNLGDKECIALLQDSQDDKIDSNVNTHKLRRRHQPLKKKRKGMSLDATPYSNSLSISLHDRIVVEALAILANFISCDCTKSVKHSASNNPEAAMKFRKMVLRHTGAMKGMAKLSLADPLITKILQWKNECEIQKDTDTKENLKCSTKSNKNSSHDSNSSVNNKLSGDPTKSGRRKKKRRKHNNGGYNEKLDTIREDELKTDNGRNADPTADIENGNKDDFDFYSEASSSKHEACEIDSSTSSDARSVPSKYRRKLEKAYQSRTHNVQLDAITGGNDKCKLCANTNTSKNNPGFLALEAFKRIITGKFDDEDKGNEEERETSESNELYSDEEIDHNSDVDENLEESEAGDDLEKNNLRNPLIFRNVMTRRSGALPFLSRAMSETLEAASLLTNHLNQGCSGCTDESPGCVACLNYIRDRVQCLSSIIDTLCCLSNENRRVLCRVGMLTNSLTSNEIEEPILIPSLIKAITSTSVRDCRENIVHSDIWLSSFRMLTSLTHENNLAGLQLMQFYDMKIEGLYHASGRVHGVSVIMNTLKSLIRLQEESRKKIDSKIDSYQQHIYDAIVLSLNILTNVLETSSSEEIRKVISELNIVAAQDGNTSLSVLSWLSRWVVSQTATFRDAVLIDNLGEKKNDGSEKGEKQRNLESHEDEFLVQAGNGFILLACFLISRDDFGNQSNSKKMEKYVSVRDRSRQEIMAEMPKDSDGISTGAMLIVNTLKAFCNFYRYSLGELSVAVVDPVLKLISKLE